MKKNCFMKECKEKATIRINLEYDYGKGSIETNRVASCKNHFPLQLYINLIKTYLEAK